MTPTEKIPAVVVNAKHINALPIIRSLGMRGVPVVAVFGKSGSYQPYDQIVGHSRYISRKHTFDECNYTPNMISLLLELAKTTGTKCVLFPATDQDMAAISENRDVLAEHYHLFMPPHEMIDVLLNKEKFYRFAMDNGLAIPVTHFPAREDDVDCLMHGISYPCIIKPSWRDDKWLALFGTAKVIVSSSAGELRENYRKLSELGQQGIVQEIIAGKETNIVSSYAYLDERSEMLGIVVGRKLRQYPRGFGTGSVVESIDAPDVVDLTRSICRQLNLVGYVGIEFKWDDKYSTYKIIEMTISRVDRNVDIAALSGFDIPYAWYRYLTTGRYVRAGGYRYNVKWLSEIEDFRTVFGYLVTKECTLGALWSSYKRVKGFELLHANDIKPFFYLLPSALKLYWSKRNGGKSGDGRE